MSQQVKIAVGILVALVVAGAAGYGIHIANKDQASSGVAEKQDKDPSAETPKSNDQVAAGTDETQAGGETVLTKAVAPSFDILRVEPSGDIVAAGLASPAARVEMLAGDEVLSKAEANAAGEWALVFDEPLAPGSYDLLLRATGPEGKGDWVEGDRVTVVIEGEKTPLVAVMRPGEPTEVLQAPEVAEEASEPAAEETVVAAVDADRADAASGEPVANEEPAASAETESMSPDEEPVAQNEPSATAETAATEAAASETAAAETSASSDTQEPTADAQAGQVTGEQQVAAVSSASGKASTDSQAASQDTASRDAEPQAESEAQPEAPVAIETVEVEDPGRLMLSGTADAGEAIRIYVNNEPLIDTKADANGRWELSSERPMPPGRYAVRADVVDGEGKVKGRAEVKFDRVQVVAEAPAEGTEQAAADSSKTGAGQGSAIGGAEAGSSEPSGEVTIVSRTAGGSGSSSGEAIGEGAGTSVIVIARGDSLWRIARKIYGQGVRHTVIFEANKKQIRDKHLIYPGQVFTIPVLEDDDNPNG